MMKTKKNEIVRFTFYSEGSLSYLLTIITDHGLLLFDNMLLFRLDNYCKL